MMGTVLNGNFDVSVTRRDDFSGWQVEISFETNWDSVIDFKGILSDRELNLSRLGAEQMIDQFVEAQCNAMARRIRDEYQCTRSGETIFWKRPNISAIVKKAVLP